jgi:hypothetical protein
MTSGDKLGHQAPSSLLTLDHGLTVLNDVTVGGGTAANVKTMTRLNARNKPRAHRQRMIHSKSFIPSLRACPPLAPKLP